MLFNSYEFIFLYLPIVFFLYFKLSEKKHSYGVIWLALASLFFYGFWNLSFLPILVISILVNILLAKIIHKIDYHYKRITLIVSVSLNLLSLCYFKYMNFFISMSDEIMNLSNLNTELLLPLGISFFTFTQIAFLVDVYQEKVKNIGVANYFLFVSYMPHLIAGPLIHHSQIMNQFEDKNNFFINNKNIADGLTFFSIGLSKKVLIADSFAPYANSIFVGSSSGFNPNFYEAWLGVLAFTFQIYFDFSGYSDMAIGISRLFNIRLPINFNSPYKSSSIIDFWRSWHITLSAFLRDYLYVPLGGNQKGRARRYVNLLITMFLGGLWHGANWTFVAWGVLHGFYLTVNHCWRFLVIKYSIIRSLANGIPYELFCKILTFLCVCVAWVFFKSDNINNAMTIISGLFEPLIYIYKAETISPHILFEEILLEFEKFRLFLRNENLGLRFYMLLLLTSYVIVWHLPNSQKYIDGSLHKHSKVNAMLIGVLLGASIINMKAVSEFLYFQF